MSNVSWTLPSLAVDLVTSRWDPLGVWVERTSTSAPFWVLVVHPAGPGVVLELEFGDELLLHAGAAKTPAVIKPRTDKRARPPFKNVDNVGSFPGAREWVPKGGHASRSRERTSLFG